MVQYREAIQEGFPEVSHGLVLFGSLSKGKKLEKENAHNADVDFTLYVDLDEYLEKYSENVSHSEIFADFEFRRLISKNNTPQVKRDVENFFQSLKKGKSPFSESAELVQEINIRNNNEMFLYYLALWHGYITDIKDDKLKESLEFFGKKEYQIERVAALSKIKDIQALPIQFEGEFSILTQVMHLLKCEEDFSKSPNERNAYIVEQERIGVARLFSLDIGGGMKVYRQAFIQKLLELSRERGEKCWETVDRAVRNVERNGNISNEIERQFPVTLKKAVRYYGVEV